MSSLRPLLPGTWHGLSRKAKAVWAAVLIVLTLGPVLLTLSRSDQFRAAAEVFGTTDALRDSGELEEVVREILARDRYEDNLQSSPSLPDDEALSTVKLRDPGNEEDFILLSVGAATPQQADLTTEIIGGQLVDASTGLALREARDRSRRLDNELEALEDKEASAEAEVERSQLEGRLQRLEDALEDPAPLVVLSGRRPATVDGWVDKAVEDLPGDFPARPSPFWPGLIGLLVGVGLFAAAMELRAALTRRRSQGPRDAGGRPSAG